jgi:cytochrome c biogenesis protein CcdA
MNELLGPVMIILGLVLLGWIGRGVSFTIGASNLHEKAEKGGLLWAFPIGFMFALSFCPVSAGLFFGGLLPLALTNKSSFMLPLIYGIGTSLPVVFFALLIAYSSSMLGKVFNQVTRMEVWVRLFAGAAFIIAGIYYSFTYIY